MFVAAMILFAGTAGNMPRFVGFYDTGYSVPGQPRGGTDPKLVRISVGD